MKILKFISFHKFREVKIKLISMKYLLKFLKLEKIVNRIKLKKKFNR